MSSITTATAFLASNEGNPNAEINYQRVLDLMIKFKEQILTEMGSTRTQKECEDYLKNLNEILWEKQTTYKALQANMDNWNTQQLRDAANEEGIVKTRISEVNWFLKKE